MVCTKEFPDLGIHGAARSKAFLLQWNLPIQNPGLYSDGGVGRQDIGGGGNVAGKRAHIYYFTLMCKFVVDETDILISHLCTYCTLNYITTEATRFTVVVKKRVQSDHCGGLERVSFLCSNNP
jgi:hypothetical protein